MVATGEVAQVLARRVLQVGVDGLRGLATNDALLLIGDDLPWVDGVRYLGCPSDCPGLWMETTLEPSLPLELVRRALAAGAGPIAVVDDQVYALAIARPLCAQALNDWLSA